MQDQTSMPALNLRGHRWHGRVQQQVAEQCGVMWCISVVNRTSLPAALWARAASRTPSNPIDARVRL